MPPHNFNNFFKFVHILKFPTVPKHEPTSYPFSPHTFLIMLRSGERAGQGRVGM